MAAPEGRPTALQAAEALAEALEANGCEFATGGAIALGYWAEPRDTLGVDMTLLVSPDKPAEAVRLLHRIGCDVASAPAQRSIEEHAFCTARFCGVQVGVLLPRLPLFTQARGRIRRVPLGARDVPVWDAEMVAVLKMMFFRRKDVADVERIVQVQGERLDRVWIRERLVEIYGARDPRIAQWDELVRESGR